VFGIFQQTAFRKFGRVHVLSLHLFILLSFVISGCSVFISSATVDLADNLSHVIINNDDLATVEAGGPAYLLMIDSLLRGDPDNVALLRMAANLYTAYATVFAKETVRAKKLTEKGLHYAFRAVCLRRSGICASKGANFQEFANAITETDARDVPVLYALGEAWAGWIQARVDDWNAIAEIPRVETIMKRVVELDEFYQDGGAHLYLGVFSTLLPPALGGKPDVGRKHFERALEISNNKNLMVKVVYARQYARLVFDRELHDRLLREVLNAEPNVSGYVLINIFAQQQAKALLDSAGEYF
jgi:hypothetical protein